MLKMERLLSLFFICFLGLFSVTGHGSQESVGYLILHDPSPVNLGALSHTGVPVAVSVSNERLVEVSSSVGLAESWLRNHVLAYYPATKITTIVVGNTVLCNRNQEQQMGFVLPSLKNVYHSLTRWGLETEIEVSASFSSDCLNPYRDDLGGKYLKPILKFLQSKNSTYLVTPPPYFSQSQEETLTLLSSHVKYMNDLGDFNLRRINMVISGEKDSKPTSRKLSFVGPFPARPTPLLSPTQSPVGYFPPAYAANSPLPPLVGTSPPMPPLSFPVAPVLPPPPSTSDLPPCNPYYAQAPSPLALGARNPVWCVAKPSVPADTLQEAIDYACGEGRADCEAIKPNGECFSPDTVLAHASYVFNSYWQRNKRNGGTCSFGGTAMLINSDPSFGLCRFVHS
ncbi:Glucan endo-1,3-beta-D-glucosidase [Bertholletia excelsa]